MMKAKKMKKSVVALAMATGMLFIGGGFVISNVVGSAMLVHAGEVAQYDTNADAQDLVLTNVISPAIVSPVGVEPPAPPADVVPYGRYQLFGWVEGTWEFGHIGYVNELPFTAAPITDASELRDFAAHHAMGNVMLPTYIPQGFNFNMAEYRGWQNHLFTAITDMPADVVSAVAAEAYAPLHAARWGYDMNDLVGEPFWTGQIQPLEDGRNRLVYWDEATLIDIFDWEVAATIPDFDTLRIYYNHQNNHLTTITVWIRTYSGWGWNNPDTIWRYESPITINGMDGFISATELRLLDTSTNVIYTVVSSSSTAANQAALIRIAESLQ